MTPPEAMPTLAPIFIDGRAINVMGDPCPRVAKILVAAGRPRDAVSVLLLSSPSSRAGRVVGPEHAIDRVSDPSRPIHLRVVEGRLG